MRFRFSILFAITLLVLVAAPWLGVQAISPLDVLSGRNGVELKIFWQLRLPRILMAWCAGATFGICGMVFQALFRNPLAEPSLLGVSSGASFGAAVVIRIGLVGGAAQMTFLAPLALQIGAFLGALLAVGIITAFSRITKGSRDATLLLAGIAVSSVFSSLIMVFQYTGGAVETYRLLSWTMGGISVVGLSEGLRALPSLAIVVVMSSFYSRELDLLTSGEEIAVTRGVELEKTRRILFAGLSVALAIVVANCGPIGFLGLISPHIARRITGHRHLPLTASTALVGGTLLVMCDTAARTLWAPADLPVGIIISFLGAPFFLWLLFRR